MARAMVIVIAVVGLGGAPAAARPRHVRISEPPRVLCRGITADRTEVVEGEWVRLEADGLSTTFEPVEVEWSVSAGQVIRSGLSLDRTAVFDTMGLDPGVYTVTARVTGFYYGPAATSSIEITVFPRLSDPELQIVTDRSYVRLGEVVTLRAQAKGRLAGLDPNRFVWSATDGKLRANGAEAMLDTTLDTTAEVDEISVTVSVAGAEHSDTVRIGLQSGPICGLPVVYDTTFGLNATELTPRIRAVLDDVLLRWSVNSDLVLVVSGLGESDERPGVAGRRAENALRYVIERSAALADRVVIQSFAPIAPEAGRQNRRLGIGWARRDQIIGYPRTLNGLRAVDEVTAS